MMFSKRQPSIARKLTWMNMLVSGVALLTACSAFISYDVVTFRETTLRNLSIRAQIIGSNCVSALLFNDRDSAEKTLAALKADPHIVFAAVYSPSGQLFASYSPSANDKFPALTRIAPDQNEIHWIANDEIVLERTIVFEGNPSGSVYIQSDAEALKQRLKLYVGISVLVLLASLLAALVVSSVFRRAVAKPIVQLAEVAHIVSRDKSYSLRVPPLHGQGEVSTLINAFNEMMAQIEESEAGLKKAHDELEHRVEERTAELVRARKEVEAYSESILRAKEDIERASKFKDQFLSTMSHELRTPLNAVLGFSELLSDARYGPLNDRQQRYVNHIHVSGQHLLQLINDILDLSKIEAGRLQLTLEDVPVYVSFAEVSGALQPLVDNRSQELVQSAARDLVVRADGTRFRQMLMNLLGNAIKFTPEDGKIELTARSQGDFVRVEVRDSGPGIPEEEQGRIFEAFHRLKQSDKATEGTGLGLAITRRLVELHGGCLGLESKPGSGSCFYFTLPAVLMPEQKEYLQNELGDSSRTAAKILVIEDDSAAADLLESQLASAGYEVTVCNQPLQAVEMAAKLQPAAMTLDIVMLPVNGWDILSSLKGDPRTAKIPVVVVTVMDQRATGALLGADEYIVKPVDRTILLAAMDRCLNHRERTENEGEILIVEDDPSTREFISELLTSRGHIVRTAADGAQARAQVQASLPRLIILDLILPKVSGLQLIAEWRKDRRTADLPILVLTNKDLSQKEREYIRTNTEAFFSKQEQWLEALTKHIGRVVPTAIAGEP
jgi:signal transduction histidine kinase/DNA-binding response OmpR family regulator